MKPSFFFHLSPDLIEPLLSSQFPAFKEAFLSASLQTLLPTFSVACEPCLSQGFIEDFCA